MENQNKKPITVTLLKYDLNLSSAGDAKTYETIQARAKEYGFKLFSCLPSPREKSFLDYPERMTIETEILFDNQFNTEEGFRIFEWFEYAYFDNRGREIKNLKYGYILKSENGAIDRLKYLKSQRTKCGYCGKQHDATTQGPSPFYCTKCLGSKYLKESELYLTQMLALGADPEPHIVSPSHVAAFRDANGLASARRRAAQRKRIIADYEESAANAKIELDAKLEILDAGFDVDNFIYYPHSDEYVYGWYKPVTQAESERLRQHEWSFDLKIKLDDGTSR